MSLLDAICSAPRGSRDGAARRATAADRGDRYSEFVNPLDGLSGEESRQWGTSGVAHAPSLPPPRPVGRTSPQDNLWDRGTVGVLTAVGFDETRARRALTETAGSLDLAMAILCATDGELPEKRTRGAPPPPPPRQRQPRVERRGEISCAFYCADRSFQKLGDSEGRAWPGPSHVQSQAVEGRVSGIFGRAPKECHGHQLKN